ncbi:MAG: ATP-binding cassette domain-containing protein [Candidatus Omnitrophica bacterium]|nr:ATP-binding cassette domain-containing protein [Candidatus Omnitrophota bacterium]
MPAVFLEIKDLTKRFGKFEVFRKLSLQIQKNEIFGLLGPNGAGKTTLIKCILQLLKFQEGGIYCDGKPLTPRYIYKSFGYLPENYLPPRELSAEEFLSLLGLSFGATSQGIKALLEKVGLDGRKKIKYYSRGMIQRLGLAATILKDPGFIILDEPTLGLDPVGQSDILSLLKQLNKDGKTIFFSSHNLFQVERICARIGVMHQGKMQFIGATKEFIAKHHADSLEQAFLKEVGRHA